MIATGRRQAKVRFTDMSGGVNLIDDMSKIRKDQVQDSLNAILRKSGIERRPGTLALSSYNLADLVYGQDIYKRLVGTETLLQANGQKLYSIDKASGSPTELYDFGGAGNAEFQNYLDKCFVSNGNGVAKVEGSNVYQVGIDAPTTASASAVAGGSLPDGDYLVYAGYARKLSGTNVLYSQGQDLTNVGLSKITIAGANKTIRVVFPDSTDTQVNNKVVWMSNANGSTVRFFWETGDNTTDPVDVIDETKRVSSITYAAFAANNGVPGNFEHILIHRGRLYGSIGNVLYLSLQNTKNVYDIEKFYAANTFTYEHQITGLFSLGKHIYLNTPFGIAKIPGGDINAEYEYTERRWHFYDINTLDDIRGGKIGLTNDGVKYFVDDKFVDYDISYSIRPEIEKIYSSTAGFRPAGRVYRRDIRTEYHLCYCDDTQSTVSNNTRLVLNLNRLEFLPEKKVIAPWEPWSNGANFMTVDEDEVMYNAQSHATAPKMYKEDADDTIDNGIYLRDGTLGTSESLIYLRVVTRAYMPDIEMITYWNMIRMIADFNKIIDVSVYIRDAFERFSEKEVGTGQGGTFWAFVWGEDVWDEGVIGIRRIKLPMNLNGYVVYIMIEQTANNSDLKIQDLYAHGVSERTRFT